MKIITVVSLVVLLLSCKQKTDQSSQSLVDSVVKSTQPLQPVDSNWISSFNTFRNAIYQGDKATAKKFFDFPVLSQGNEIWSIIGFDDPGMKAITGDDPVPFKESDFDRYFHKLFPKDFINAVLKVKAKELYSAGNFETAEVRDTLKGQYSSQRLFADFDKVERTLTLNLNYTSSSKGEDGEDEFQGESSVVYVFDVLRNGQLRFKAVHLAG